MGLGAVEIGKTELLLEQKSINCVQTQNERRFWRRWSSRPQRPERGEREEMDQVQKKRRQDASTFTRLFGASPAE